MSGGMQDQHQNLPWNAPLISIVAVVLNGAETLERAIQSVLEHKSGDCEYIIIDGGSTDGSVDIIKKYQSCLTYWASEPDHGVYDAMNKAIRIAKGKWVYFLGADDQLLKGFESAAKYLKNEKTIYYGDVYRPVMRRNYDGAFSAYKLACRNICHQSIFYPRCVWERYSYNLKYPGFADYELNLRCFIDAEIKFEYIPASIAVFADEGGISATQVDLTFEKDKLLLIKSAFPFWIYTVILIRSFLLKLLARLGLQNISTGFYHYLLRARQGNVKEINMIKKNIHENK